MRRFDMTSAAIQFDQAITKAERLVNGTLLFASEPLGN